MIKRVLLLVLFFTSQILFISCKNNTIDDMEIERRRIEFKVDSINYKADRKHWEKDYEGAITLYNEALRLDNRNIDALGGLALLYYEVKNYADAIRCYTIIIESLGDDQDSFYYLYRGKAKYYMNDFTGALSDFDNYFRLKRENRNSYYNAGIYRGLVYLRLNRKNDACRDFSKAGESGQREAYNLISMYCN